MSALAESPLVIGRYALHAPIASGGMGVVHFATTMSAGGRPGVVAAKRLHPHLRHDQGFALMLLDEARLAVSVRHPNVVQVLDVVSTPSDLLLVMEYVPGLSVQELMTHGLRKGTRAPMPLSVAITIAVDGLRGLHAAPMSSYPRSSRPPSSHPRSLSSRSADETSAPMMMIAVGGATEIDAPPPSMPEPRKRHPVPIAMLALVAAAVVVSVVLLVVTSKGPQAASPSPAPMAEPEPAIPTAAPPAVSVAAPGTALEPEPAPAPAPAPAPSVKTVSAKPRPATPKKAEKDPKADCNPPYTEDETGKHFKAWCLRP